jgi:hypothetical protein
VDPLAVGLPHDHARACPRRRRPHPSL